MLKDNIQKARQASGLSKAEVARRLDMNYTTYDGYETGRRTPKPIDLPRIAEKLGVDVNELLYGKIMADQMKEISREKLQAAIAKLSASTRDLGHSILCRNFDLLNSAGQKRLLEDSEMYVTYPKYQNEEAIRQYNERVKNAPIREITLPVDTDDDYTQAEIDEYNEALQRIGKKEQTDS